MSPVEISNLAGTGGLILALIWAVRYTTAKWEASQAKLIGLLENTIARNTEALHEVSEVLGYCRASRTIKPDSHDKHQNPPR